MYIWIFKLWEEKEYIFDSCYIAQTETKPGLSSDISLSSKNTMSLNNWLILIQQRDKAVIIYFLILKKLQSMSLVKSEKVSILTEQFNSYSDKELQRFIYEELGYDINIDQEICEIAKSESIKILISKLYTQQKKIFDICHILDTNILNDGVCEEGIIFLRNLTRIVSSKLLPEFSSIKIIPDDIIKSWYPSEELPNDRFSGIVNIDHDNLDSQKMSTETTITLVKTHAFGETIFFFIETCSFIRTSIDYASRLLDNLVQLRESDNKDMQKVTDSVLLLSLSFCNTVLRFKAIHEFLINITNQDEVENITNNNKIEYVLFQISKTIEKALYITTSKICLALSNIIWPIVTENASHGSMADPFTLQLMIDILISGSKQEIHSIKPIQLGIRYWILDYRSEHQNYNSIDVINKLNMTYFGWFAINSILNTEAEDTECIFKTNNTDERKRVLLCAPSNGAADNLVSAIINNGVINAMGGHMKIKVLRFGKGGSENLRINSDILPSSADVVVTTLGSSGNKKIKATKFSAVIVDEAGQCVEPELQLSVLDRDCPVIIVGDQFQLRPTVLSPLAEKLNYRLSFMERFCSVRNEYQMLNEQYRMTPSIGYFVSAMTYQGKVSTAKNIRTITGPREIIGVPEIVYLDESGYEEYDVRAHGYYNENQISILKEFLQNTVTRISLLRKVCSTSIDNDSSDWKALRDNIIRQRKKLVSDLEIKYSDALADFKSQYLIWKTRYETKKVVTEIAEHLETPELLNHQILLVPIKTRNSILRRLCEILLSDEPYNFQNINSDELRNIYCSTDSLMDFEDIVDIDEADYVYNEENIDTPLKRQLEQSNINSKRPVFASSAVEKQSLTKKYSEKNLNIARKVSCIDKVNIILKAPRPFNITTDLNIKRAKTNLKKYNNRYKHILTKKKITIYNKKLSEKNYYLSTDKDTYDCEFRYGKSININNGFIFSENSSTLTDNEPVLKNESEKKFEQDSFYSLSSYNIPIEEKYQWIKSYMGIREVKDPKDLSRYSTEKVIEDLENDTYLSHFTMILCMLSYYKSKNDKQPPGLKNWAVLQSKLSLKLSVIMNIRGVREALVFSELASRTIELGKKLCETYASLSNNSIKESMVTASNRIAKVAVIAPYASTVLRVKHELEPFKQYFDISANTVDSFQGQEADMVIYISVRSNEKNISGKFCIDPQRLNVALSRAQAHLIIIGNPLTMDPNNKNCNMMSAAYIYAKKLNVIYKTDNGSLGPNWTDFTTKFAPGMIDLNDIKKASEETYLEMQNRKNLNKNGGELRNQTENNKKMKKKLCKQQTAMLELLRKPKTA